MVDSEQQERALAAFGHEETEARRLVIFGGGNIGMFLAEELEETFLLVNGGFKKVESDDDLRLYGYLPSKEYLEK